MFIRAGLQAEYNALDRLRYHLSGLKGIKMADLASLRASGVFFFYTTFKLNTCKQAV